MRKNIVTIIIVILAAVVYFGTKSFILKSPNETAKDFIDEAKENFGNTPIMIGKSHIERKLDSLISSGNHKEATLILDTLDISESIKMDYKGQIAFVRGDLRESIWYFSEAIARTGIYSNAVHHRARAYSELKIYDSAVLDYRIISAFNYDFYRPLAETFEKMNKSDSALKYYRLFLKQYPDSVSVKQAILKLENGG